MKKLVAWAVIIMVLSAVGAYFLKDSDSEMKPNVSLGAKVTVLELVEDSRCPIDVQCIQAGTVRVRASVDTSAGSTESVFKLEEPALVDGWQITLVEVKPAPHSQRQIAFKDYDFDFIITRASN